MVIPTGTKVLISGTSRDVIHSWWIPALNGKKDMVPGRVHTVRTQADEPGIYAGQCTEFCGLSHANMRLQVIAQTPKEFDQWVAEQQEPAAADLSGAAAEGQEIFTETCVSCHAVRGLEPEGGDTGPDLTHFASRELFAGDTFVNNDENLARWIDDPEAMKPGVRMPDYGLDSDQIAALVAYLRSLE